MTNMSQVFAQSYPRYLLRIVNRHEEFYALLMFFVERHYLRTQGAFEMRDHGAVITTDASYPRCVICGELLWAEEAESSLVQDRPGEERCRGSVPGREAAG